MKVYTKSGDGGTTSLVGGERVPKYDERVEAYGTIDELMACTALLQDELQGDAALAQEFDDLTFILSRLMDVAALLAVGRGGEGKLPPLGSDSTEYLEHRIDAMQSALPAIDKFTIPGGRREVSLCDLCRTVCRRAERAAWRADAAHGVEPTVLAWLNRLSDYLYLLGRRLTAHFGVEERLWRP